VNLASAVPYLGQSIAPVSAGAGPRFYARRRSDCAHRLDRSLPSRQSPWFDLVIPAGLPESQATRVRARLPAGAIARATSTFWLLLQGATSVS
jgi:hypothetical protein